MSEQRWRALGFQAQNWSSKNFLEKKEYFAIANAFLNERAGYLGYRIYPDITNLWIDEHSIVLENGCPKLCKDAKQ